MMLIGSYYCEVCGFLCLVLIASHTVSPLPLFVIVVIVVVCHSVQWFVLVICNFTVVICISVVYL